MGIVESLMQTLWTADPRKLESHYAEMKFRARPAVTCPSPNC